MISRPKLKSHLSAEVIGPNLAVIISDVDHWPLQGPVYPQLLPLLDGTRSVHSIVDELRGRANVAEVHAALLILERSGYLATDKETPRKTPINMSVVSVGSLDSDAVVRILQLTGATVRTDAELTLVLTDEYLRSEVADFAAVAASGGRLWLPFKTTGTVIWLGPVVQPPVTPCWNCVLSRIRANRPVHAWLNSRGELGRAGAPMPNVDERAIYAASAQLVKWARQRPVGESHATLMTFEPESLRTEKHVVVRRPGCPDCGNIAAARTEPNPADQVHIELQTSRRIVSVDGGWRSVPPEATFKRYKHHVSKVTGVVSRLRRRVSHSGSIELYTAEHLFDAPTNGDVLAQRRISAGKGISRVQARTSALCEALERCSGVFRGTEARVRSSCDTLGDAAVHPNTCANFSDTQFEQREIWNAQVDGRTFVPHRIAPGELLEWTPVWSLRDARVRYVPTAYCYYGYRDLANIPCFRADSNGCAAGNRIEEAILQGFLELVERDAVGIWWYNEIAAPVVELTTFPQRSIRKMVADYDSAGGSLEVLDLTTDLGIPVFAAASFAPSSAHPLLLGFGAHLDAGVALGRAITELNQWRTGSQLGQARPGFSKAWNDRNEGEGPGHFLQRRSPVRRKHDDFPPIDERDLSGAIRVCVARAAEHGLDTLVLDQTREDIGLPVVRVIVPGLRHFWPRFGPGRLYDVPVELGWRSSARTESQLNNFHILI